MVNQVFKRIALNINILLSVLLLAGNIAGYISPLYLAIFVLFGLFFPYFLFLNLVFLIFWILLRHKYFVISLLSILISIPLIINTYQIIHKKHKLKQTTEFTVMSYNVRLFDLYNWSQNKRTRDKMFQLIRETGPDIACFQEYFNSSNSQFPVHDSLIRNQKFRYSHLFFNVQINNGHQFGIATYSAYPIVNRDVIEFSGTHNVAIISDIKINTDTLRVINCHLESVRFLAEDYVFMDSLPMLSEQKKKSGFNGISNRLLTAAKKRAIQADAISKKVEQSPYPTMVCGDFNDTPSSYTYQKIARLLNDSFTYYKFGVGGTYNRFFPPLRIDYILYNSAVNCHNFQTIKSNYSDHYPVIGYYSLQ